MVKPCFSGIKDIRKASLRSIRVTELVLFSLLMLVVVMTLGPWDWRCTIIVTIF